MTAPKDVYAIEGLDRLGKSTLIDGILNTFGYYEIIHFSKPKKLDMYITAEKQFDENEFSYPRDIPKDSLAAYYYQSAGFRNSMLLAKSGARVIFDRWHIGEAVYSPMYRKYSGDYVFTQELCSGLHMHPSLRLILLVEDFKVARHFVDDGQSLGPIEKREEEQKRFVEAFFKSHIQDKRIITVTDPATGGFRNKDEILKEAIE